MAGRGIRSNGILMAAALMVTVLLVLGAGGFVTYELFFKPVWTETLDYKNSTGQYCLVTKYRNATDPGYPDLKEFLDAENLTLKAAIDVDDGYRPVEYAVRLHDDAQRSRINCSLVPVGVSGGYPGHVLVAFYTKDSGMVFVDPTAMNVSSGDYPGLWYDRIIFLRDQWNQTLPDKNDRGQRVVVREYRETGPVSYSELLKFLAGDDTEQAPYVNGTYTCADFAACLHNAAEARGIANAIVCVGFEEDRYGHCFNAFPTTDMGIVYIDNTGIREEQLLRGFRPHDNVVYLKNGSLLGEFPAAQVDGHLDYEFYVAMSDQIAAYRKSINEYADDKGVFEEDVDDYERRVAENGEAYRGYEAECGQLDAAVRQYKSDFKNRTMSWPEIVAWSERLDDDYAAYVSTYNQLEAERVSLNQRLNELNRRFERLTTCEESKWVSYYPQGTVKEIRTYW